MSELGHCAPLRVDLRASRWRRCMSMHLWCTVTAARGQRVACCVLRAQLDPDAAQARRRQRR
jgi:hypothetical protein